ncbi:hypothetical protein E3A20_11940, partial [Planctomyces bekefii]
KALRAVATLWSKAPEGIEGFFARGLMASYRGDFRSAYGHLLEARQRTLGRLERQDLLKVLDLKLARLAIYLGDKAAAESHMGELQQLFPDYGPLPLLKFEFLLANGDATAAAASMENLYRERSKSAGRLGLRWAIYLLKSGDQTAAAQVLKQLLEDKSAVSSLAAWLMEKRALGDAVPSRTDGTAPRSGSIRDRESVAYGLHALLSDLHWAEACALIGDSEQGVPLPADVGAVRDRRLLLGDGKGGAAATNLPSDLGPVFQERFCRPATF